MIKSSLFIRMLLLTMAAVLLSSALACGIYYFSSSSKLSEYKQGELQPRAESLASVTAEYWQGNMLTDTFKEIIGFESNLWGAYVYIFNSDGELQGYSDSPAHEDLYAFLDEKAKNIIRTGADYSDMAGSIIKNDGYIVVGTPIKNWSGPIGALFLVQPFTELFATRTGLVSTLWLSILIAWAIMLVPCIFAAKQLIKPIAQMRDVAAAMAEGDFRSEANVKPIGEIGELGTALNELSSRLSATINELTQERNMLRHVIDDMAEGIIAIDETARVFTYNSKTGELLRGGGGSDWIYREQIYQDMKGCMASRQPQTVTYKKGDTILLAFITPSISEGGSCIGAVALIRDITESERLEQTRRDYVANVSHELRTPVASLRGLAEALSDGMIKSEEDRARYYGYILHETMRLTRLIEDLLELSRLQSGNIALKKNRFDVCEVMHSVYDRFLPRADDVGINLHLGELEGCPEAYGNEDRTEQVLIILMDNALKFTPVDGDIYLYASWNDSKIEMFVKDTGEGISPDDIDHVFERFYKADKAHTGSGTGLGLSIASEIMNMLDEEISVTSEEGKGACFRITTSVFHGN